MENYSFGQFDESFESVIQGLTDFMNCVLNISEKHSDILRYDFRGDDSIEYRLQKYLRYPQNCQTLQHYIKVLKRFSDKKIEDVLPDEEYIEERKEIKKRINDTVKFITDILNRRKQLSVTNKYLNYNGSLKKLNNFKDYLIAAHLIENSSFFLEIFQGKAPEKRINWIGGASNFKYFINELFKLELFANRKQKWLVTSSSFLINNIPVPSNIRTYKNTDVNKDVKTKIIIAISYLN